MKKLADILAQYKPSRETRYGNPDTMRIAAADVAEWVNSAAGIDTNK